MFTLMRSGKDEQGRGFKGPLCKVYIINVVFVLRHTQRAGRRIETGWLTPYPPTTITSYILFLLSYSDRIRPVWQSRRLNMDHGLQVRGCAEMCVCDLGFEYRLGFSMCRSCPWGVWSRMGMKEQQVGRYVGRYLCIQPRPSIEYALCLLFGAGRKGGRERERRARIDTKRVSR